MTNTTAPIPATDAELSLARHFEFVTAAGRPGGVTGIPTEWAFGHIGEDLHVTRVVMVSARCLHGVYRLPDGCTITEVTR